MGFTVALPMAVVPMAVVPMGVTVAPPMAVAPLLLGHGSLPIKNISKFRDQLPKKSIEIFG